MWLVPVTKVPFRWNGCVMLGLVCYKGTVPLERARMHVPTKVPFRWNGLVCISHVCYKGAVPLERARMLGLVCYKGAVPLERARMHIPRMLQRCRSAGTGA